MMTTETITQQHIDEAEKVSAEFQTCTRPSDGGTYVIWTGPKNGGDWVYASIRAAHGDALPDDYVYRYIADAFEYIAEAGADDTDPDDCAHEFADSVDIYTSDLLTWVASSAYRQRRANDALREGMGEVETIDHILMRAQYEERREVFDVVWQALCDHVDSIEG